MKKALLLYIPVLHHGYFALIERHQPADVILITSDALKQFDAGLADQLTRDIRVISPKIVAQALHAEFPHSLIMELKDEKQLRGFDHIVLNRDDISLVFDGVLKGITHEYDPEFLRWDWSKATVVKEVIGKYPVTTDEKDRFFIGLANDAARRSSDTWRQVGAVIPMDDGKAFVAFNVHFPTATAPYENGDPRLHCKPGENPEICTAGHAEAMVIADAAGETGGLKGKSMYVTTFPCAGCARSIVRAGIKKVFFKEGYSKLDAEEIFAHAGVEVFQVR